MVDNIIQIGLYQTAEYYFFCEPYWKRGVESGGWCYDIPKSVYQHVDSWLYYGLDISLDSIDMMRKRYMYNENTAKFICAGIKQERCIIDGSTYIENNSCIPHLVGCITLSDLLRTFDMKDVGILICDIEGDEFGVFKSYDWYIKPRFMNIEIHDYPDSPDKYEFIDFIISNGYSVYEIPHQHKVEYINGTVYNVSFVRDDCI